jgi:DNA-binding MarR family transcriptional regulator
MASEPEFEVSVRETATAVRRSVTRLARTLRLQRAEHGVSTSKLIALAELMRAGPMTAAALAARQHIQPQSLTRILVDLKKRGLIHSEQAETDRRQVRLDITQKGRELLLQDAVQQDAWLAGVMQVSLTEPERAMLNIAARILTRLSDQPLLEKNHGPSARPKE